MKQYSTVHKKWMLLQLTKKAHNVKLTILEMIWLKYSISNGPVQKTVV